MAWLLFTDPVFPEKAATPTTPATKFVDQLAMETLLNQFPNWQGNVNGGEFTLSNVHLNPITIEFSGDLDVANLTASGNITAGGLTLSGSATAASLAVTGALSGASAAILGAITGASLAVTGAATAASIAVTGTATAASLTVTGAVTGATLSLSGAASAASLTASGTVSAATVLGTVITASGALNAQVLGVTQAALGTAINDNRWGFSLNCASGNADALIAFIHRTVAGSSWDSADWRIQRWVDGIPMGAVVFSYFAISLWTDNAERLRVASNGNIGFGVPAPAYKLDMRLKDLASTAGSWAEGIRVACDVGINDDWLRIMDYRQSTGTDWTSASFVITRVVDTNPVSGIEFRGNSSLSFYSAGVYPLTLAAGVVDVIVPLAVVKGTSAGSAYPGAISDWGAWILQMEDSPTKHGAVIANRWRSPASMSLLVGSVQDVGGGFQSDFIINGSGQIFMLRLNTTVPAAGSKQLYVDGSGYMKCAM